MLKIKHRNTMNHCLFKAKDTKGAVGNTLGLFIAYDLLISLNHPTFNQIKKRHGINYSDRFYIRFLYAVPFMLS